MIEHQLFYMLTTMMVSIFTLGLTVVVYRKTKAPVVQSYLALHLTIGLGVLGRFFAAYHLTTRFPAHPYLDDLLLYQQGFIVPFLLIITLPRFIHQVFDVPHSRRQNAIFFGIAMLTYSLSHFFEYAVKEEQLRHLHPVSTAIVVFVTFFYSGIQGLRYIKTLQEQPQQRLAKIVLLLIGLTIPIMLNDAFNMFFPPFHPMLYMISCLLISHHFLRYDLPHVQAVAENSKHQKPDVPPEASVERSLDVILTDERYQQYDISPREQELVPLVLQGYSNQQIGETLCISLSTVKTHLRSIYSKFGVKNRYELIAFVQNLAHSGLYRNTTTN